MPASFKLDLPVRPRRLRRTAALRELVRETQVRAADLIAPLFVVEGDADPQEIASMPGQFQLNLPDLVKECRELWSLGIRAVALFPQAGFRVKGCRGHGGIE